MNGQPQAAKSKLREVTKALKPFNCQYCQGDGIYLRLTERRVPCSGYEDVAGAGPVPPPRRWQPALPHTCTHTYLQDSPSLCLGIYLP